MIFWAALGLTLTAPVSAEEMRTGPKAVVELFTSQGCSSCPPADALLAELAERDDIVALGYHVDYWDYIGWPDTFASSTYSDFQRAYADSWGSNRIYTPQMVINGAEGVVGSRQTEVDAALGRAALPIAIDLTCDDETIYASIAANEALDEAVVWLVTFKSDATVDIERGENRDRSISYVQIVTGRQALGIWDPAKGIEVKLPLHDIMDDGSDGVALLLQSETGGLPGPILAAASVEF